MAERDTGGFATAEQLNEMFKDNETKLLTGLEGMGVSKVIIRKVVVSTPRKSGSDGSLAPKELGSTKLPIWPD